MHIIFTLEKKHKHSHSTATTFGALMGMLVHTFFDGFSIVAGYKIVERVGVVVLIAVLLHNISDGLTISSIVFSSLNSKKKALGSFTTLYFTQFFLLDSRCASYNSFHYSRYFFNPFTDI